MDVRDVRKVRIKYAKGLFKYRYYKKMLKLMALDFTATRVHAEFIKKKKCVDWDFWDTMKVSFN